MSEVLYENLNLADMVEEFDRLEKGPGGSVLDSFVMLPKEGSLSVRLLPPLKGKKFYCETRIHRLVFPNGRKKNIHCTKSLQKIGKDRRWVDVNTKDPCPICKYYNELWSKSDKLEREGDKLAAEELRKQARLIKPSERYYYNCIVRQQMNPKTEEIEKNIGPKILSIPMTVHQKIVRAIVGSIPDEEPALGDVSDVKTGRDFKIVKKIRKGTDFPEYSDSKFMDPSPLGDREQVSKWLANLHDLAALRRLIPHKEMDTDLKKYLGLIPMEDEEDTEFTADNASVEDQIEEVMKKKSPVVSQIEEAMGGSGGDEESLTDDEFFNDLRNLG